MDALRFPYDGSTILRQAKRLRREGLARKDLLPVRLAILGGWTTQETVTLLELFLLKLGIRPEFYQSEYNKYYEDAVLDPSALEAFGPQIVYLHTASVNLRADLAPTASREDFEARAASELRRYREIWKTLRARLRCTIIQNNFDLPVDPLGHFGGVSFGGRRHLAQHLNLAFAAEARVTSGLVIHDLNASAARLGHDAWFDSTRWFSYKILVTPDASAALAHSVASIVAAATGKARKCLVLDLDNTLWGGVIGDDGVDRIRVGRETPEAEAYTAFQEYCLELHRRGVLLAVCSKNEDKIARQGLAHRDSVLREEHFSAFFANWEPKSDNIRSIAKKLNIGLDSLVFVDDNPAEREIVRGQLPMVEVPEIGNDPGKYVSILAAGCYFETVSLSAEDAARASSYQANAERDEIQAKYASYDDYLAALEMKGEIARFVPKYIERITQLINKTNQFNLTTRRHVQPEVEAMAVDPAYIALYGRLADRFGDNGLISIVIARISGTAAFVDLWLMSCRVLKRGMEHAMLDALVDEALRCGVTQLRASYLRTEKNAMVADHYERLGFTCVERHDTRSDWTLSIGSDYEKKNRHIVVSRSAS